MSRIRGAWRVSADVFCWPSPVFPSPYGAGAGFVVDLDLLICDGAGFPRRWSRWLLSLYIHESFAIPVANVHSAPVAIARFCHRPSTDWTLDPPKHPSPPPLGTTYFVDIPSSSQRRPGDDARLLALVWYHNVSYLVRIHININGRSEEQGGCTGTKSLDYLQPNAIIKKLTTGGPHTVK